MEEWSKIFGDAPCVNNNNNNNNNNKFTYKTQKALFRATHYFHKEFLYTFKLHLINK